jgi:serine/threonine protein kinase
MGRACPCSVNFAAKTGKRAVERILHKSIFFQDENVLANVELQTEAEAAFGDWKSAVANHVIEVEACHVEVGELLGKGGFCLVHNADIMLQEGQKDRPREEHDYCVKFLKPNILLERRKFARGIADLAIEAHFLATLNHPHIMKIRGVTVGVKLYEPSCPHLTNQPGINGNFFLILDKLHSTLDKKIERTWKLAAEKYNSFIYRTTHDLRGAKRLELKRQRLRVVLELATAMQYLHEYDICYRDLKPDNIGFDGKDSLKLFDFGLAKELKPYKKHADGTYHLTANTGSRRYMAPEVALRKRYNLSVDVFSFGILFWEICTLTKPFKSFTEVQHMNLVVCNGHRPKLDCLKNWPTGVKDLITKCWQDDLYARPPFCEIVESLESLLNVISEEDEIN